MNFFSTSGTILALKQEGERQIAVSLGRQAHGLARRIVALLGLAPRHGAGEGHGH